MRLRWFSMSRQQWPLSVILAVPLVLQIALAIGLAVFLSVQNGNQAVNEVARQLQAKITEQIEDQVKDYIATAHRINRLNVEGIALGQFNVQDLSTLERHFWYQLQEFPSVTVVKLGTEEGGFVSVTRLTDGRYLSAIHLPEDQGTVRRFTLDENGSHDMPFDTLEKFSPQKQSWYQETVNAGKGVWSQSDTFAPDAMQLSLYAGLPFYGQNKQLVGVAAVDGDFKNMQQYLKNLNLGINGEAFIVDRQGQLIGSSTQQLSFQMQNNQLQRLQVKDIETGLIPAASEYLLSRFTQWDQIAEPEQLDFELKGRRHFLQVSPLVDERGLDWLIVVVVPESNFVAQIQAYTQQTLFLCLATFALASILSIVAARRLTRPILRLAEASSAIASGDLNQRVPKLQVKELDILSQSFNQMTQKLQQSFAKLAQTNEQLEVRVQERTKELAVMNALLLRTTSLLEKRNQELDQFAYVASHDLKAPLRAINNLSEWIEEDLAGVLTDDTREQMELLRSRVYRMENLIDGLLAYSRAGRMSSDTETFDVDELLAEVIDSLGIPPEFTVKVATPMPTLTTERLPLQQIFSNLISNAIKHHHQPVGQIEINCQSQENVYEFSVKDDGPGIDPDSHDKVFQIFLTLSTEDTKANSGIGLSIVKKLVESQGGSLSLESQVGSGSTFRFTWPK